MKILVDSCDTLKKKLKSRRKGKLTPNKEQASQTLGDSQHKEGTEEQQIA